MLAASLVGASSAHADVAPQVKASLSLRNVMASIEKLAPSPATPDLSILTTEPVARTESSGYGWREDPIRKRQKFHHGADYRGKTGTPVLAAGDGVVVFAGRQGGYGNVVYIDHGGGVVTRYGHLRRIETKKGATIAAGERLGQLGSTGRATGPHLHFEVRLDGRDVDPNVALTVASLMRESPDAGKLAAYALSPELQASARDMQDPKNQRALREKLATQSDATTAETSRPERANAPKRQRALW